MRQDNLWRIIISTLVLLTATMFALSPVYANSGPVFWQGYPAAEVMAVAENCPIQVEKEDLTFDFIDTDQSSPTLSGKVTATYQMANPTDKEQSVQMAFPFVGNLDSLLSAKIDVTADGRDIPYEIYFGDAVKSPGSSFQKDEDFNYDFASIINNISDDPYKAGNFADDEYGKLYTIEVQPASDERINFAVDFFLDPVKTKVLTYGFNRYEREDGHTRIAAWCYEPRTLEIFVLGENIESEINGFTDGALAEKTDLFTCEISVQEIELKPYLIEFINNNIHVQSGNKIFDNQSYSNQLYKLYAKTLDQAFDRNIGYASEHDLWEQAHHDRILTVFYTVVFPANSTKEVSVSYKAVGTMDRTETPEPLYTFDYILNPAQNWKDFKNLNIKIFPPPAAPFVVASNIDLVREEENAYTADLATLPEGDFSFTLYSKEQITFLDTLVGNLYNWFGYFSPLAIGVFALLNLGLMGKVILKGISKRRKS